ncbi:MAG: glutamate--tRNA ligase [Planctomycetes bacterium]|nr:glutamate--tRNA ligase [Planctomycetota bacterium]
MVVTRFAPSPTGYLHVGGARTALFCWLMARHHNGRMILRIEDTDQKRNTPTAAKQVQDDLRWLGIEWDEGPEVGGPNGPYAQSERLDIYKKYMDKLLAEGKAYYCFDTPEELKAMRDQAEKAKKSLIYRAPAVLPTEADAQKAREEGRPVTVRFAMPDKDMVITDVVRDECTFKRDELSDFIIQKSDGFPTYHFACVVDDELMEITHIIRGQEHLMNTPWHVAMQESLGFKTPVYVHMSVTMSETGGKLSKRERPKALKNIIKQTGDIDLDALTAAAGIDAEEMSRFLKGKAVPDMPVIDKMAGYLGISLPEINVVDFMKSGYLPETMVNFLALLGWNPGGDREIMTTDELIECFDISRFAKSNSLFDRKKLLSFNTEHIRMLSPEKLLFHFKNYLKIVNSVVLCDDDKLLARLVRINEGARTLADIERKCRFLFADDDDLDYDMKSVKKVLLKKDGLAMLGLVGETLKGLGELSPASIEKCLRGLAEEKEVGLGKVAQPLRVGICGNTVSPPIFDSVDMLGMDRTLNRIEITLKKFGD